jgi:nucleotide-binding universal stress UspA family protein
MLPIRTILYATDFSENSAAAFRVASSLARDYGAQLIVLHVQLPSVVYGDMGAYFVAPEGKNQELMKQLRELKPEDPAVVVDYRLVEGDPAEEILHTARETNSDVIVLGTHGRKGLGRLLLGSVAEQTVRTAPCPVVTVKPPSLGTEPRRKSAREVNAEEAECGEVVRS